MADFREEIKKRNQRAKVDKTEAATRNKMDMEARIEKAEEIITVSNKEDSQKKEAEVEPNNRRWVTPRRTIPQKQIRSTFVTRVEEQDASNRFKALEEMEQGQLRIRDHFKTAGTGHILIVWRKAFVKVIVIAETPQLMSKAYVETLKSTGSRYTWTNNQDGVSRIYSKIDHAFANEDWAVNNFFETVLYKCVSKLLCSRLSKVLPKVINHYHGAFIKGRSIAHNVMILQDLLKNYSRKIICPRCAIKIDLSRAYDTINWDCLEALLNAYNMPQKFVRWVMICIRSTSYSIIMNGRVQGSFKGEKGLRQGDLLSPLLFVLVMEYLTILLHLTANTTKYRFHPICKSLRLINLCFVDDLISFSKGSSQSLTALIQVLEEFSNAA
uniref:Reverse transcriptase domain-containing protein n=1 Tax=Cannabis sativa TaxID=3483 RepID=A0A803NL58_CANSA